MHPIINYVLKPELEFIASLDQTDESRVHMQALEKLIFEQGGAPLAGQNWFPYEVIKRGSQWLHFGHEREFAFCTLLVIAAVKSGFEKSEVLAELLNDRSAAFEQLPAELASAIFAEACNAVI